MNKSAANRSMFRRILRRLLFANRGRLFVILLALSAGAAVSAALLNLQVDAKRRLSSEFRSFGPNVLVTPPATNSAETLDEKISRQIFVLSDAGKVRGATSLYTVAEVSSKYATHPVAAVVVGFNGFMVPGNSLESPIASLFHSLDSIDSEGEPSCVVGAKVSSVLKIDAPNVLTLRSGDRVTTCTIVATIRTGGPEDNQVQVRLDVAQRLANLPGRISLIELTVPGDPKQLLRYTNSLRSQFPGVEVHPLRQFSEAQAKIYSRISGLLTAATALILALTALCVMAAMTNIAAERRNDVGMMKAIGGSARRVLDLFLTEAVILGLAGGLIGAAAGIALSMVLGKAVFGVAAAPRLIVYPISVALTVIVAILGAYPLRRLVNVRPATIFRGEA